MSVSGYKKRSILLAGRIICESDLGVLVGGNLGDALVSVESIAIAVSALICGFGDFPVFVIADVGRLAIVSYKFGHALLLGIAVASAKAVTVELNGIHIARIAGVGSNRDSDPVILVLSDDAPGQDLPFLEVGVEFEAIILRLAILIVKRDSGAEIIVLGGEGVSEEREDKLVSRIAGHVDGLSRSILGGTGPKSKNPVSKSFGESLIVRIVDDAGVS